LIKGYKLRVFENRESAMAGKRNGNEGKRNALKIRVQNLEGE
jgi:hypothetical protein